MPAHSTAAVTPSNLDLVVLRPRRSLAASQRPSIFFVGLLLLLLCNSYLANLIDAFFPLDLFGFVAIVTVIPTGLLSCLFVLCCVRTELRLLAPPVVLGALCLMVAWIQNMLIPEPGVDLLHRLNLMRCFVLVPMYIIFWREVLKDIHVRRWISLMIIFCSCFIALLGLLHLLHLPTIYLAEFTTRLSYLDYDPTTVRDARFAGLSLGANMYSNTIILGLALLCYSGIRLGHAVIAVSTLGLLLSGVLSSGSRWPMLEAILLVGLMVGFSRAKVYVRVIMAFLVGLAFLLLAERFSAYVGSVSGRFEDMNIDLRPGKTLIGLQAISHSWLTVLIGASSDQLRLGDANEDQFSDNSFLNIACTAGVPMALVFWSVVAFLLRGKRADWLGQPKLLLVLLGGTMLLNNANLWDMWLFQATAAYWLIRYGPPRGSGPRGAYGLDPDHRMDESILWGVEAS